MAASQHVFDVDQTTFQQDVVERSREVPVVVDFWAEWCGPCRTLGPALEQAVDNRDGQVVLAKLDVDSNQAIAQQFRIQGIPAVKAFRDGQVVAEFTGAVPPGQIESFLDQVVPTEADKAAAQARAVAPTDREAAMQAFERALDLEPKHRAAAIGLAELVVEDDPERALQLVKLHRPDPDAEAVATRAELALSADIDEDALRGRVEADPFDGEAQLALGRALAARQEYGAAIDHLLAAVRAGGEVREPAREQLIGLFNVLGDGHELVRAARPKLANALF